MKSSNREPLSSPECTRATTHHIHHKTTPTNTSDRSVCRFGDMCRSARCPWCHPNHSGTTRQPQQEAGSDMRPPWRRTIAAVSAPAEETREPNWEVHTQRSNWAQGRPTHGSETSPNRTQSNAQGDHEVRAQQQPPNAVPTERAISKHAPPFPLQGAHVLHKGRGCAPRVGRCPPRGWQQGRDQPTARGTVNVIRRREIRVRGVGEWDRRVCATEAPRSANRQVEEQHRHTGRGSHTRRDECEHSRQGGGA